jgi:hypothetical protein
MRANSVAVEGRTISATGEAIKVKASMMVDFHVTKEVKEAN